jgi:hypothetical protein
VAFVSEEGIGTNSRTFAKDGDTSYLDKSWVTNLTWVFVLFAYAARQLRILWHTQLHDYFEEDSDIAAEHEERISLALELRDTVLIIVSAFVCPFRVCRSS